MQHPGVCHHHGALQQSSPNLQDPISQKKREQDLALSMDWGSSSGWPYPNSSQAEPRLLQPLPPSPGLRDCGKGQRHELRTGCYKDVFKAKNHCKEEKN